MSETPLPPTKITIENEALEGVKVVLEIGGTVEGFTLSSILRLILKSLGDG